MTEEAIKKYISEQSEESKKEDSEGAAFQAQATKAPWGARANHHLKWWLVTRKNVTIPSWLNYNAEHAGINVSRVLQEALMDVLKVKRPI